MDYSVITDFVTSVGFPIAVCLICFWYINKMSTDHKEEMNKMSEAINNNTMVMQRLLDRIGEDND